MKCDKNVEVQYLGELPIDTLEAIPDFILAERDIEDGATGNIVRSITRVPGAKLFPNTNMDNVFALEPNNEAIEVPENQVRACFVQNQGVVNMMQYADSTHPAVFLAVGEIADMVLCQCSGVVNLPMGHNYIIGMQYYVGANGEPTTDPTSGQKLFVPVSNTKLVVNL